MEQAQIPWWAVAVMAFILAVIAQQALPFFGRMLAQQNTNTATLATLLARIEAMEDKQATHDGLMTMVTRLDEQLSAVRQQLANQGPVIAQVVAMTLKETFAAIGIDRRGVARA